MNRYYIVNSNDENLDKIFTFAVTNQTSARYSLDGSKVLIKLKSCDKCIYDELSNYTEYVDGEIHSEIESDSWRINPYEV